MKKGEIVEVVLLDKDNNVLVDAKEFGLDVVKANTIQETFFIKQEELKGFQDSYLSIINSEITDELSKEAKDLRNKPELTRFTQLKNHFIFKRVSL